MTRGEYRLFEDFMLACAADSAHGAEHVYRVLYNALEIARSEARVDFDVLVCACLLHDIGRKEQLENPKLCHAQVGAEKARRFLAENGFSEDFARAVEHCVLTHRFRKDAPPESAEAKILFDADKLDAAGALGIARTLLYKGKLGEPLYTLDGRGEISRGGDERASFFGEYKFKLEKMYGSFYTKRGAELAKARQKAAADFYEALYAEASATYGGKVLLEQLLGG